MEKLATSPAGLETTKADRHALVMLALMVASQIINHFDRAVLAVASADIMQDLGLTLEEYGLLASVFYSVFSVSGLLVGLFFAHRVRALTLVTWLIGLWTISQVPVLLVPTFAALLISRMILGAAESPSFGAATAVVHEWYPAERRSIPTSFILFGSMLGGIVAPPTLIYVMSFAGWKGAFVVCAAISGVLFLALLLFGKNPPAGHQEAVAPCPAVDARGPATGFKRLDPRIALITLLGFMTYWVISFSFTWLFPMLHLGWGYSQGLSGWLVSGIYFLGVIPLLGLAAISQRMLKRGTSFRRAVVLPASASLFGTAILLSVTAVMPGGWVQVVFLALAFAMVPSVLSVIPVMVSRIASESERNRLLLVVSALQSSAGIAAPYVTGLLIARNDGTGFDLALYSCAVAAVLGGLVAITLFKEPQPRAATAVGI